MSDGLTMTVPLPLHEWLRWPLADRKASGRINPSTGTWETQVELWQRLDRENAERGRTQRAEDEADFRAFLEAQSERRARSGPVCERLAPEHDADMKELAALYDRAMVILDRAHGRIANLVKDGLGVVPPLRVTPYDQREDVKRLRNQLPDRDPGYDTSNEDRLRDLSRPRE